MITNRNKSSDKRKFGGTNNAEMPPVKKLQKGSDTGGMLEELDESFLVKHPKELVKFWEYAQTINPKAPRDAFAQLLSLELVGPFHFLNDQKSASKIVDLAKNYIVKSRFSTDLPEMQTLMVYRGGRFCYWRDVPDEEPDFLVHVENEPKNFPLFTIVGDKSPFCALAFLVNNNSNKSNTGLGRNLLPKQLNLQKFDQKFIQDLRSQRKKTSLGKPFHGMGIKVEVNEKDVGYRPVTDNIKRLRTKIEQLGTTESEDEKKALKDEMYHIYSCVQFANDEMDFGMGLEFGHDLFVSNYECFDGMARSVLCTAYRLLKREKFAEVLEKHWKHGRRVNDKDLKM